MVRLGLTSMNYRSYLEHRRKGKTLASAAFALGNMDWLLSHADTLSRREEIADLIERYRAAKITTNTAVRQIVRRKAF